MRHGEQRLPGHGSAAVLIPLEICFLWTGSLQTDPPTRTAAQCRPVKEVLWEVWLERGFAGWTCQPGPWLGDAAVLWGAALKKLQPISSKTPEGEQEN